MKVIFKEAKSNVIGRVAHGGALHVDDRGLLAMSDRNNGEGRSQPRVRIQHYCWGNRREICWTRTRMVIRGFAIQHVLDIGVRETVYIPQ